MIPKPEDRPKDWIRDRRNPYPQHPDWPRKGDSIWLGPIEVRVIAENGDYRTVEFNYRSEKGGLGTLGKGSVSADILDELWKKVDDCALGIVATVANDLSGARKADVC